MKRIIYLVIFTLIVSCSEQSKIQPTPEPDAPVAITEISRAQAIELQPQTRAILEQNNSFALNFFKVVSQDQEQDENLFLSPYSMSAALGMLYNGAEGETKAEIAKVLGMDGYTPEEVNSYYKELTEALLEVDPSTSLSLANAIWANKGITLKNSFAEVNQNYYDAEVSTLDFSLPSALQTINRWSNEKTKGTIPEILKKIEPTTIAILANAIYFNSFWITDFDKSKTANKTFHNIDGTTSSVPMMHQKQMMMEYAQMDNCGMVTLPYANEAFTMNLILPEVGEDIDALIEDLDRESWQIMRNHGAITKVTLSMPRFKVENNLDDLADVLKAMGMPRAFSDAADFSAMFDDVDALVSKVIQKSYISVDEAGTEAAAVTVIVMDMTSGPPPTPEEVTMVIDRPFIFAITEQSTGAILFMGKITKL